MATLAATEILMDVLDAFKIELFPINAISTDLKPQGAVLNQQVIAHVAGIPTTSTYSASTGFANGSQEAETLLTDVPVTLDQMPTVSVKIDYLTQLASQKPLYTEAVRNIGYALAKAVIDDVLAEVVVANFSHAVATGAADNFTLDSLEAMRSGLNSQSAAGRGRFAIVNTTAGGSLGADARVAGRDYYAQTSAGTSGYRKWSNIAGFDNVWEYPSLPTTGGLHAFGGDPRAIIFASAPIVLPAMTDHLNINRVNTWNQVTDPETGLTITGVGWEVAGVADVFYAVSILYGVEAGRQGGSADTITDKAGIVAASQAWA